MFILLTGILENHFSSNSSEENNVSPLQKHNNSKSANFVGADTGCKRLYTLIASSTSPFSIMFNNTFSVIWLLSLYTTGGTNDWK